MVAAHDSAGTRACMVTVHGSVCSHDRLRFRVCVHDSVGGTQLGYDVHAHGSVGDARLRRDVRVRRWWRTALSAGWWLSVATYGGVQYATFKNTRLKTS